MKNKNLWLNFTIVNLLVVAILGFTLRSKILFSLPSINYLNLLDAHSHFAFGGWVTLALLLLMVNELLPASLNKNPVYPFLFSGIILSSYGILFSAYFNNKGFWEESFSDIFILTTYIFGWIFIKNIWKSEVNKSVLLLSISAVVCLILSSAGILLLDFRNDIKPLNNPFFFLDELYVYLHFNYNGFFILSVFALLFHKLYKRISDKSRNNFHWFSILLCTSVIPSLFLSFLWQDPNNLFRIIAISGSILILSAIIFFVIAALPVLKIPLTTIPIVRYIAFLSLGSFLLKMFLQCFTIFPSIGNAVFGDRPVIIGYLHLVFLGFVTPFILAYYVQIRTLNTKIRITNYALIIFLLGAIFNEIILMLQGFGAMFLISSYLFSWLLWLTSIWILTGAFLIFIAKKRSGKFLSDLV